MSLFWLVMEWGGVVLALSAAYLMSKNSGQEKMAWCIFLAADATHSLYYLHMNQIGLVYNQSIGFVIALLGLAVICHRENKLLQSLVSRLMNFLIVVFFSIGVYFGIKWMMMPNFNNLEWTASFISLTGTALLASNSKFSRFGFFAWLFCDVSMLYVAIMKSQFGIIVLRVIYTMIDFNGIKQRFFNKIDLSVFKRKQVIKDESVVISY